MPPIIEEIHAQKGEDPGGQRGCREVPDTVGPLYGEVDAEDQNLIEDLKDLLRHTAVEVGDGVMKSIYTTPQDAGGDKFDSDQDEKDRNRQGDIVDVHGPLGRNTWSMNGRFKGRLQEKK